MAEGSPNAFPHARYWTRTMEAVMDGRPVQAVCVVPIRPALPRSARLARYDRLAPPVPDLDAVLG